MYSVWKPFLLLWLNMELVAISNSAIDRIGLWHSRYNGTQPQKCLKSISFRGIFENIWIASSNTFSHWIIIAELNLMKEWTWLARLRREDEQSWTALFHYMTANLIFSYKLKNRHFPVISFKIMLVWLLHLKRYKNTWKSCSWYAGFFSWLLQRSIIFQIFHFYCIFADYFFQNYYATW